MCSVLKVCEAIPTLNFFKYRKLIREFNTGSGTCDGEEVSGEVCTSYLDRNSQKLAGVYSVVQDG